jgi:hypothetical protein
MDHLTCDLCGKALLVEEGVRYEARIQVYAAYDPLELTAADLAQDTRERLRRVLEQLRRMDPQEAEDSVYREFLFDLCPACQRRYLRSPLPPPAANEAQP